MDYLHEITRCRESVAKSRAGGLATRSEGWWNILGKYGAEAFTEGEINAIVNQMDDLVVTAKRVREGTKLLPMLSSKTIDNILSSGQVLDRNGLTIVGRALQKHASRPGAFRTIKFSHSTAAREGVDILKSILNSKNPIIHSGGNGGYHIFDGVTGRGFGLSRNGFFNGFRQLP